MLQCQSLDFGSDAEDNEDDSSGEEVAAMQPLCLPQATSAIDSMHASSASQLRVAIAPRHDVARNYKRTARASSGERERARTLGWRWVATMGTRWVATE